MIKATQLPGIIHVPEYARNIISHHIDKLWIRVVDMLQYNFQQNHLKTHKSHGKYDRLTVKSVFNSPGKFLAVFQLGKQISYALPSDNLLKSCVPPVEHTSLSLL